MGQVPDSFEAFIAAAGDVLASTERLTRCLEAHSDLPTVVAGALGDDVVAALRCGRLEECEALLAIVEGPLTSGIEPLRTILATGLLEAVWGQICGTDHASVLWGMLGPHSREYLRAWDVFHGLSPE